MPYVLQNFRLADHAGLLGDPATAFAAQRALYRITRREFPDRAAFDAWWTAAREGERVDWVLAAEADRTAELVQVWRQRLAENPELALEAIQPHQLRGVRSLGYDAMGTLAAPERKPPDSPEAKALIRAFESETMPELRRKILGLVPRFLEGQAALALIDKAMQTSPRFTGERVEAARALALIRPVDVGREGTLHYLQRAFQQDQALPSGNPEVRLELLSSLEVLGVPAGATEFGTLLLHALAKENDRTVRDKVFSVAGFLGDEGFFDVLLPYARDADRSLADRSAALDALTRLAERVGKPEKVLGLVHELLGHPDANLRFRAILAARRLKDVSSAPVLAGRLGKETEEWLVTEILKTLAVIRDPGILDALLAWPVPRAGSVRKEIPGVLRFQVGEDAGLLVRAVGVLGGRNDWDLAFPLLEGYRQGGKPPNSPEFERAYTRTLAHWLLQGDLENGREARAADAVERLGRLAEKEPADREWPRLLARLQTRRGRAREAVEAWKAALGGGAAPLGEREWPDFLLAL
ncbi:MAG: HEAT repeat domain-containing protein, partial [Planctomycetota bacterium]